MEIFIDNNNKLRGNKGSALLEFALIAPILFLLFAGIIQFGFIMNAKIVVNSASYEGARAATLSDEPEESAATAVLNYASSAMPGWDFSERLKIETSTTGNNPGDNVIVKVTYYVPNFFNKLIPISEDEKISITGESIMQLEEKE